MEERVLMTVIGTPDVYTAVQNTPLNVNGTPFPSVIANDISGTSPANSAALSGGNNVSNGSLVFNPAGTFTYTPTPNYYGSDDFEYVASGAGTSVTLITASQNWNYLHITNNVDPAIGDPDFNTTWFQNNGSYNGPSFLGPAPAPFHYGGVDGLSGGTLLPDPGSGNRKTEYFTTTFNFSGDPALVSTITASLLVDDGMYIYLNGVRIGGHNMTVGGADTFNSFASGTISETAFVNVNLTNNLVVGANFLAVSVRSNAATSSDMGFSFQNITATLVERSAPTLVTINIPDANVPPVGAPDNFTLDEGGTLHVPAASGLMANDGILIDPTTVAAIDGSMLPFGVFVSAFPDGSLDVDLTFASGFAGVIPLSYILQDKDGMSTSIPFTITVNDLNNRPIQVNDGPYTVPQGQVFESGLSVLDNDVDFDAVGPMTAVLQTTPSNGTVQLQTNGEFTYTPHPNFIGNDSFTYKPFDGIDLSLEAATVALQVVDGNRAPVLVSDGYTVSEDTLFNSGDNSGPGLYANDGLIDQVVNIGMAFDAILSGSVDTTGTQGIVMFNFQTGHFTFSPTPDFVGVTSFTYTVTDKDGTSAAATVTLNVANVNDAPTAVDDGGYSVNQQGTLATASLFFGPNSQWSYDDTNTNWKTSLASPNLWAGDTFDPQNPGGALPVWKTGSGIFGFGDLGAAAPFATKATTLIDTDQVSFYFRKTFNVSNAAGVIGLSMNILRDDGVVVYLNGQEILRDNIAATGVINHGTTATAAIGGNDERTYFTRNVTLTPGLLHDGVNLIAVELHQQATNSSDVGFDMSLTGVRGLGILGNDVDIDSVNLTSALVTSTTHGTLQLASNGEFIYTPSPNFIGVDSFQYRANDGALNSGPATVSITVTDGNLAPGTVGDTLNISEDQVYDSAAIGAAASLYANDGLLDGNGAAFDAILSAALDLTGLSGSIHSFDPQTGHFVFEPLANFSGATSFQYTVSDKDGQSNSATVTINIAAVDDSPVAGDDAYNAIENQPLVIGVATGLLANDSDADSLDPLTAAVASQPAKGSVVINADGSFTYTPGPNFNGIDTFTYTASDGSTLSQPATVTITIAHNAAAGPAVVNDAYTVNEDGVLTVTNSAQGVLANENGGAGNLALKLPLLVAQQPANGSLTLNADGTFTYTPATNFNGVDTFRYVSRYIGETNDSAQATVTITVLPVLDVPDAVNDSPAFYRFAEGGGPLDTAAQFLPGVLANDVVVDAGVILAATLVSQPQSGTVTLSPDGHFIYTSPSPNFNGPVQFTYRASVVTPVTLVSRGGAAASPVGDHVWRYRDDGVDQGTAWRAPAFNDSGVEWKSGVGQFGYGDGDERTVVGSVDTDPVTAGVQRNITTYFRTTFDALHPASIDRLELRLLRDDGAVVYLNGVQVVLSNMPAAFTSTTPSTATISNADETTFFNFSVNLLDTTLFPGGNPLLATGNVLAVEIHQSGSGSSDISFDLEVAAFYSDTAQVTVIVDPLTIPAAPIGVPDNFSTPEDVQLAGNVMANEFGPGLTVQLVSDNTDHGLLVLNPDGSFTYTPDANFNSTHLPNIPGGLGEHFLYTVSRSYGGPVFTSDPVLVLIDVTSVPDAPKGVADDYVVETGQTLTTAVQRTTATLVELGGKLASPVGSHIWNYLDTNIDPGPLWKEVGFDDSTWKQGVGEFGYGDTDQRTTVGFVDTDPVTAGNQVNATTLFRTTFNVADPLSIDRLIFSYRFDDGIAIYLNGRQVARNNLAANAGFNTFTTTTADDATPLTTAILTVAPGTLIAGDNVIAVELHQASATSSDITFDLRLVAESITADNGVLANDSDGDYQTLTATLVTGPAHHDDQGGASPFTLNPDGSFTYKPAADFSGDDSFTYTVSDGVTSGGPITVTITVPPLCLPRDVNCDGVYTTADIDALSRYLFQGGPLPAGQADLTGGDEVNGFDGVPNGVIDENDRDFLITVVLGTFEGDANYDIEGGIGDFVFISIGDLVVLAGNFEQPGTWSFAQGDFNGDNTITIGDLVLLAANFGRMGPVPTPPGTPLTGQDDGGPAALLAWLQSDDDDSDDEEDAADVADLLQDMAAGLR